MSVAEHFSTILRGGSDGEFLSDVIGENRWFTLGAALLIRDLTYIGDIKTANLVRKDFALSFMTNSYRGVVPIQAQTPNSQCQRDNTLDVIDSFLSKSVSRIVPNDNGADTTKNIEIEIVNEDVVTEQFAKILLLQGHKKRAITIYNKLSLKFPEKSVYFADQIDQINR